MRNAVGLFGLLCGVVVIWMVGYYGYSSTDDPAAKLNMAFLYGVVATAGLFGHVCAVRLWHEHHRVWSAVIGLTCFTALVLNLSNSLGALAGRSSKATAEVSSKMTAIKDDRDELARLQRELDRLGSYVSTDAVAVDAATRAFTTSITAKERECGNGDPKQRGRVCRERELAEQVAAEMLTKVAAAKATTDRAASIEAAMAPIRDRLRVAGPVAEINIQGNAMAKLFRLPASEAGFAAVLQNFLLATVVETIIILSMIIYELLGTGPRVTRAEYVTPAARSLPEPVMIGPRIQAALPSDVQAAILPPRPKPKLAITNKQSLGSVLDFLYDGIEIAHGSRTDMVDAFVGYSKWCRATGHRPMSVSDFVDAMERACHQFGIRISVEGDHHYILDMHVKKEATAVG